MIVDTSQQIVVFVRSQEIALVNLHCSLQFGSLG